ncbi:hypothetical protein RZS28_07690 [Methylocapsa polymorpha]|uniref:Uncharacterized protein n=1 Tax=Methylocapsa polymorpha TaxID=3080828 RepID=A0ABZ0HV43_9HYPH|nr:hypothetical protein RZS28_07690 [Methylocapsa sp. RX1]
MAKHIYSIGQQVSFDGSGGTYLKLAGVFTVTRLMPPLGTEFQYRIKGGAEAHERVVLEHELRVPDKGSSIGAADSRASSAAIKTARVFMGQS